MLNKKKILLIVICVIITIFTLCLIFKKDEKIPKKKVKDINPIITLKSDNISVVAGSTINFDDYINVTLDSKKDNYKIEGTYDLNTPGTYDVYVISKSKLGKEIKKNLKIIVNEKKKEEVVVQESNQKIEVQNSTSTSNKLPYYTEVIRNQNVVVVYGLDDNNNYTKIVKVFTVSNGLDNGTPTGTFNISDHYIWRALFSADGGTVYGQYATRITGHILFHSVPYIRQSKDSLESEEYNKLGNFASLGCVRMRVVDVKWIHDNLATGSVVKIYDGDLPNGVKKPVYDKIDLNDSRKGWDPTDPDKANPWR